MKHKMNLWDESFNKIKIGYSDYEIANPDDMLAYYSIEKITKYGVLGIEILVK